MYSDEPSKHPKGSEDFIITLLLWLMMTMHDSLLKFAFNQFQVNTRLSFLIKTVLTKRTGNYYSHSSHRSVMIEWSFPQPWDFGLEPLPLKCPWARYRVPAQLLLMLRQQCVNVKSVRCASSVSIRWKGAIQVNNHWPYGNQNEWQLFKTWKTNEIKTFEALTSIHILKCGDLFIYLFICYQHHPSH